MSQAKVDKYKKEKKNRPKAVKRARRRKTASIFIAAALIGAIVGYPLGKGLYKHTVAARRANATVDSGNYDVWFDQYYTKNYSYLLAAATATDAASEPGDNVKVIEGDSINDLNLDDLGLENTATATDGTK